MNGLVGAVLTVFPSFFLGAAWITAMQPPAPTSPQSSGPVLTPQVITGTIPTADVLAGQLVWVKWTSPTIYTNYRTLPGEAAPGMPPIDAESIGYFVSGTKAWACLARTRTIWEGKPVFSDLYTIPRPLVTSATVVTVGLHIDLPVTRP